jgi:uncharacterized membrane protein
MKLLVVFRTKTTEIVGKLMGLKEDYVNYEETYSENISTRFCCV